MKTLEQLLDEEMAAYYDGEYMDHGTVKARLRELLDTVRSLCRAEAMEALAPLVEKAGHYDSLCGRVAELEEYKAMYEGLCK